MKRIAAIILSVLGVFTAASGAMAQSPIRATIPFDFTADNRVLPAGSYEITPSLGNFIRIQNVIDPHTVALVGTIRDSAASNDKTELIFEKYGNWYFLREIVGPGVFNVTVFFSKKERQIREQAALVHDAGKVLIAAK